MAAEPVRIALVVARAENGVIGAGGTLPWHISADLQHFKRLTVGKPIIMGRKTYDSIGKPLPRRTNIVLTRNKNWRADGAMMAHDHASAMALAYEDAHRTGVNEVIVIGGAEVFHQTLRDASRIYLTEVHRTYVGDTVFNPDLSDWTEVSRTLQESETPDGPAFSYVTLERRG